MEFEILEEIAVLSTSKSGWNKELNKVSWNKRDAKYDIRDWDPEHNKCGKGVTLTDEEAAALLKALQKVVPAESLEL